MLYVALKLMLYDKVRSFITLLGVIFAVSLTFAQMGIFLGLVETSSVVIDNTPGDIWITSKNCKNFDFSQPGAKGSIIIGNTATNDSAAGSIILTKVF